MMTYLVLNLIVIIVVVLALRIKTFNRAQRITLLVVLAMTAVGDALIVGLGIVGYDSTKILGVFIAGAPIEDFLYAVLAVILVPTLWRILKRHHD